MLIKNCVSTSQKLRQFGKSCVARHKFNLYFQNDINCCVVMWYIYKVYRTDASSNYIRCNVSTCVMF